MNAGATKALPATVCTKKRTNTAIGLLRSVDNRIWRSTPRALLSYCGVQCSVQYLRFELDDTVMRIKFLILYFRAISVSCGLLFSISDVSNIGFLSENQDQNNNQYDGSDAYIHLNLL